MENFVRDVRVDPGETSPLRAAVRYWPLTFVIAALGLLAGVVAGGARHPVYTSETRLAIGGQDLSSQAIPGYALASQELAADYARYVSLPQESSVLQKALGAQAAAIVGLSASPVPNSNIISLEAQSKDQALANQAATVAGSALMTAVNSQSTESQAATLLKQYNQLSAATAQANDTLQTAQLALTKLEATPAKGVDPPTAQVLAAAKAAVDAASTTFSSLQLQQTAMGNRYTQTVTTSNPSSNVSVIQPSTIIESNKTKNLELFGVAGLALGIAAALVGVTLLPRLLSRRTAKSSRALLAAEQPIEIFTGPFAGDGSLAPLPRAPRMSVLKRRVRSRGSIRG
jgi:hypothetical protein